jgi:DNA-binding response OmpR family regulator
VEDEYPIAHDLEAAMHDLGFDECDAAPNARQAHSLSMSEPPDIVVLDVCLKGGREGIEVARWLRQIFEVPVVFVTSYNDDENWRMRATRTALAKPVYTERLAAAIAEAKPAKPDANSNFCRASSGTSVHRPVRRPGRDTSVSAMGVIQQRDQADQGPGEERNQAAQQ